MSKAPILPIGASLRDAKELYGEPEEEQEDDDDPETTIYTFDSGFQEVVVSIKNDRVISVTYWADPKDSRPSEDLAFILDTYAEGQEWVELTPGYSMVTKNGRRRADFSVMPSIGVREVDYQGVRESWAGSCQENEREE
ncbi:MAG: hypothetical protein AAF191_04080 [Verrucomicrobiota bacterium]